MNRSDGEWKSNGFWYEKVKDSRGNDDGLLCQLILGRVTNGVPRKAWELSLFLTTQHASETGKVTMFTF